jgi:hypothetical protein
MEVNFLKLSLITLVACLSSAVIASPTAYLPIGIDNHLQLQVDHLFTISTGNPMRKPYGINEIEAALEKIKPTHPSLYNYIARQLDRYRGQKKISRLGINAGLSSKKGQWMANQRGLTSSEQLQGSLESVWRPKSFILAQLGIDYRAKSTNLVPYNTFLAFSNNNLQLELGYKEHWYSPFKFSSRLISSNAKMGSSVSVSTIEPIENWWRLKFDLFYTRLDTVKKGIRHGDTWHDGRPHLLGTHINMEPINGWKLGFNRLMQFGGGPREVSFGDVVRGFIDPAAKDNSYSKDDRDAELGDQLASVTTSYHFGIDFPVEIYAELAGEDTQGQSNLSLGNQATGFGVFLPKIIENLAFRYEYNRFKTGWYTNHNYRFGNTNDAAVFGHYAGDQRKFDHGVPTEIHKAAVEVFRAIDTSWGLSLASISNKDRSLYEKGYEFQLQSRYIWQDHTIESKLIAGESVFSVDYVHFSSAVYW